MVDRQLLEKVDVCVWPEAFNTAIVLRDEKSVLVANVKSQQQTDEDDPYKDYVIPDDLMW